MSDKRRKVEVVPSDIARVFDENDIAKVFDVLKKQFKISAAWEKQFKVMLGQQPRNEDLREIFGKFLKDNLDPALKHITKREDSVIFAAMRYVVKDKIKERQQSENESKNYYPGSGKGNG